MTRRSAARLWTLLLSKLVAGWGVAVLVSFGLLAWEIAAGVRGDTARLLGPLATAPCLE